MAIPVWPEELPARPLKDGYQRSIGDGRLFTPMGQGAAKVRRRYSAAVKPITAQMQITADQFFRFERFWEEDTVGGTQPFLIVDAVAHDQPLLVAPGVPLLTEAGVPILVSAWWVVMFGQEAPNVSAIGGLWYRVSFSLNVMP